MTKTIENAEHTEEDRGSKMEDRKSRRIHFDPRSSIFYPRSSILDLFRVFRVSPYS